MSSTVELMQLVSLLVKRPGQVLDGIFGNEAQVAETIAQLKRHFVSIRLPPPPPEVLQKRVVGGYVQQFCDSGNKTINDMNAALARSVGRTIGEFRHVLDFGVGCGRVIRRIAESYPETTLTGADIDAEAIAWLTENYTNFGKFITLPHSPPSMLPDRAFDLVYSVSVFTHLPEDLQFAWLAELRRVTSPGGILLISVHGENYLRLLPKEAQNSAEENGGFYYNMDAGITSGLPEFYKNTYHSRSYIEQRWADYFDIIDYRPLQLEGHQDIVVCQRR